MQLLLPRIGFEGCKSLRCWGRCVLTHWLEDSRIGGTA